MAVSRSFAAQVEEALAPLGCVRLRSMFSGAGVYCDDVMLGIVIDERLYLKTSAASRPAFEAEGAAPFSYDRKDGRRVSTSMWQLPDRLWDEPEVLADWAREALTVASAGRKATAKRPRQNGLRSNGASDAPPTHLPSNEPRAKTRRPSSKKALKA